MVSFLHGTEYCRARDVTGRCIAIDVVRSTARIPALRRGLLLQSVWCHRPLCNSAIVSCLVGSARGLRVRLDTVYCPYHQRISVPSDSLLRSVLKFYTFRVFLISLLYSSEHILLDPTILIIFSAITMKTKINLYVQDACRRVSCQGYRHLLVTSVARRLNSAYFVHT